jgi:hypothetical protein
MDGQLGAMLYTVSTWIIPAILAITLHEAAHGYVACVFGDTTAWALGRVTLNPFKHIDPFGTIILPGLLLLARSPFLFGYAKPVPVNFSRLRNPKATWFGSPRQDPPRTSFWRPCRRWSISRPMCPSLGWTGWPETSRTASSSTLSSRSST